MYERSGEPCAVNAARTVRRELRHEVAYVFVVLEYSSDNPMFCHWYSTRMCGWSNPTVQSSWDNEASFNRMAAKPRGEAATASIRAVGS
jgi:hypothetical protein